MTEEQIYQQGYLIGRGEYGGAYYACKNSKEARIWFDGINDAKKYRERAEFIRLMIYILGIIDVRMSTMAI